MRRLKRTHPSIVPKDLNNEKGFTLLEVIFSMTFLAIGLLAICSMQASSMRSNAFASGVSQSTTWASDKIEKLILLAYNNYNDPNLSDTDGDGDGGLGDATTGTADHWDNQGNFSVFWNISDNSLLNNTKTISVIVTWTDRGAQKNVSMRYVVPRIN